MKTQKKMNLFWFTIIAIALFALPAFSSPSLDDLLKQAQETMTSDVNLSGKILDEVIASPDANDYVLVKAHSVRISVRRCQGNIDQTLEDYNAIIEQSRNVIQKRLAGQTSLSQEQILSICRMYWSAIYRHNNNFKDKPDIYFSRCTAYVADILTLGPYFDEPGRKSILKMATEDGWLEAARTLINEKRISDAHKLYEENINTLNNLDWATPEILDEPIYAMTIGALVTSDMNDEEFIKEISNIIKENREKSWSVRLINLSPIVTSERRYEILKVLIDSNPTSVNDEAKAQLYYDASSYARQIGKIDEAVSLFRTLKQKYPDSPLSKTP